MCNSYSKRQRVIAFFRNIIPAQSPTIKIVVLFCWIFVFHWLKNGPHKNDAVRENFSRESLICEGPLSLLLWILFIWPSTVSVAVSLFVGP